MNFDLNDEQQEIKRTAHEFLASRFKPEKVRELAEARSYDDGLWKEISELGWPGIAISEDDGGQGLGMVELAVLLEESGYACAPSPLLGTAGAALVISAAGSDEQRSEWLPKLASGEATGSFGGFADGQSTLFCDLPTADVVVTFDGDGALLAPASEVDFEPFEAIDATRSYGLVSEPAGEPLPGDVAGGRDRLAVAIAAELTGHRPAGDRDGGRVRARAPAVRPADRRLPGRSATAARRCCSPPRSPARSPTTRPGPPTPSPSRCRWPRRWPARARPTPGWQVPASALQVFGGIGFTWEHDLQFWLKRGRVAGRMLGTPRDHRERVADLSGLGAGEPAAV